MTKSPTAQYWLFQQSLIWEGSPNNLDRLGVTIEVRAKDEQSARRKADRKKRAGMGRTWVLISSRAQGSSR